MNERWQRQTSSRASRLIRYFVLGSTAAAAASFLGQAAQADTFTRVSYDRKDDSLVVTMRYRGTNPNHNFSLKWGACQTDQSNKLPAVSVEVLDDQFEDRAQQVFKKTVRLSLADLPCRPAVVTLRTAPRFYYTLTIPQ